MRRALFTLGILLASCDRSTAQTVVLPEFISTPTPYIDPSYPTSQAAIESTSQLVNGIQVHIDRAWVDGKNMNAEVCYTTPDASDWSIHAASLNYADVSLDVYGTTLLSVQEAADGRAGERCDTLTFVVPPDADLTRAVITIAAIGTTPRDDEYCSVYMPKIQQAMVERGIGIVLECTEGEGGRTMKIVSLPAEMTQEQAEQVVYSDEFFTVTGPWSFSITLSP
jgi:hypothetical protein